MDFHTLSRRQLQALCKKNKIPANQTNVAMASALSALPTVEGLEELSPAKGLADGGASVAATTTRRTSRVKDAGVLQNRQTPAKVKTLDFTEEVEVILLDTPAPVPASRRRGTTTKGGETALKTALGTRRSTRLASKSTPRGSETAAPNKMEFEDVVESFGGISLDEKSEQVGESDLSAEKQEVSEVVEPERIVDSNDRDETKIELVTVSVDAAAENDAVENGDTTDMSEEVMETKQDAVMDGEILDGTDEQVIDEKEIQSSVNVERKESNVEAMADVDANEFENTVEEVIETKQDPFMDVSQTEAKNDEVLDGTDEQIIDEKEIQSSENVEMKESNVEAMDNVDANEFEKDVGQLDIDVKVVSQIQNNSEVDYGTDEQVIDEGVKEIPSGGFDAEREIIENEGSSVEDDMSDADESEVQSSDSESEDERDSESDDLTAESGGSEDDSITETVVEPELVNNDDLTESGDSEDDRISETVVEPELVIALGVPSAAAEVLEHSLAEKLDSIELKDDVVEEDNVMEDSKVLEMEKKPMEEEGLKNNTAMEMNLEKPEAAMSYSSPVKIPQLQMSVRKTPTSGKRMMVVRFSDEDKENSMIGSIGAKLMMLTSPTKERSEEKESLMFKESQNPYKADELSLRKLKKELKAKLSENANNDKNKVGGARQALQALPENRQVMESN